MKIELFKASKLIEWSSFKLALHTRANRAKSRKIKRGQVYRCYLGENIGNEESKERPCVILQNDVGNIHSPNTIVAPITNTAGVPRITLPIATQYDGVEVLLTGNILLGNIVTVSKARLGDLVSTIPSHEMEEVDRKLMTSVGLFAKFKDLSDRLEKDKKFITRINNENFKRKDLLEGIRSKLKIENDDEILSEIEKLIKVDNNSET